MKESIILPVKLPYEDHKKIQEILNDNNINNEMKSIRIYYYYKSLIPYCRTPGMKQKEPELFHHQIKMILDGRD